jgi:phosphatidate cytidylyltransferase
MPDQGDEERGSGFDDLFEDLDKFFAPEDRPEGTPRRDRSRRPEEGDERAPAEDEGSVGEAAAEAEGEEDILPADWLQDIEGIELAEPTPLPEEGAPIEEEPRPPVEEEPVTPAADEGPARRGVGERPSEPIRGEGTPAETFGPTAEMSQQDWSRLREVLGDEHGKGEGEEIGVPPAGGTAEDLFRYEEEPPAEEEEHHELTLDDLKKAPAQYRHLPRPEDEEFLGERDAIREDQGAFPGEGESLRDDFADLGERPLVTESAEEAGAESWGEPAAIADVEAAADQMAEEFRTGLPAEDELLADIRRPGQRSVKVGEPESLMGPTWEEPGSQVVTTEPAGPAFAGRNMPMALLTAVVLAFLALISIAIDRAFFAFIAGGVVLVGQAEVYAAMHRKGYQPATALGLVVGGLMLAGAYLKGEQAVLALVLLGAMLSFLWYMAAAPKAREGALGNIGATMLGLIYVPGLAGFLLIILAQPISGRALTLAILGMTFLYDAAAFVIGSLWGSRALAPTISPKKSWEGLFAATVITLIVSLAVLPSIDPITFRQAIGMALVIAVFAPLGDLAESLMKRDLGVKDMGSVLPGHGGIMDRIDSVLFVIPAAFYFLRLIF